MGWLFLLLVIAASCRDVATDVNGQAVPEIHGGAMLLAFVVVSVGLVIAYDEINRRKPS